jgi:transcriptional regulator with PAS, ATPase and Fis domain
LRKDKVFLPINCGALPENLLESELFGYVKGAFTGAVKDKKGRFELADGGTIFLDEIAEVSPAMQVKLLRVLQEGTFERLGDTRTLTTDVRIISATNKDLRQQVMEGKFREDLYYRLCVIPIDLPSLQQRGEDVPELAREFITHNRIGVNPDCNITPQAVEILKNYSWPGNVRELQNAIQYALIQSQGDDILPEHLPPNVTLAPAENFDLGTTGINVRSGEGYLPLRRRLTPSLVRETLLKTDGNKAKTARLLGVGRATLYRFLKKHPGLEDPA